MALSFSSYSATDDALVMIYQEITDPTKAPLPLSKHGSGFAGFDEEDDDEMDDEMET